MQFPDELDFEFYGRHHPDLHGLDRDALERHYREHGRHEGRCTSAGAKRELFLDLVPKTSPVLEIGPFCHPVLSGENVRYFDVRDAEGLRERARNIGFNPSGIPSHIHYVSPNGDLSVVVERFVAAVSSHCIEHQPDLVFHLRQVQELLSGEGCYFLIIPDKRYCFDHFIPDSTIATVIEAHIERRTVHSIRSVIEHRALTTHNDPLRHWQNDHADPQYRAAVKARTRSAIAEHAATSGHYLDVHAWQFTPESFREITRTLCLLGYTSMWPVRVYSTPYGRNEFTAVLQKIQKPLK